ncbi:ATP-binding cassette domain-containing protein (plasmid) [Halorussus limi]|uniref:ATP-binding cassette domain-containing protein n=1 Tax=Halorussus limi TaxID=2938695 RepID=A0A8U0I1H5_9EURY|nr:ATP-binding cassette domain-containing protein [Halorussus limi]UPV77039.1 ATP-binding cassette domain-containing protein [Halorussus limi]
MIRAEEFTFQYPTQDTTALDRLSFKVDEGEVLGVVGPVEAGKTTLAMALASFAPQNTGGSTDGTLTIAGRDPREATDNQVAMVFEDYSAQLTQVRVIDEVIAPLVNRGIPRREAIKRARELLDDVRLDGIEETKFSWELSGGQQQRLAIAAALAIDPDVMIFDTATDMLDPAGQDEVANLIASLKGDKTLVVTDNDPDALVGIADKLLVLNDSEQAAFGPADDLLRDADLLENIGVAPPVCVRIARKVGLSKSPLTPGEFLDALDTDTSSNQSEPVGHVRGADAEEADMTSSDFGKSLLSTDGIGHDGEVEGETVSDLGDPLLRAEDVRYEYGSNAVAVEDVAFSVRGGEVHAIIGGNGAGKTTFSKLLVGLFKPDDGTMLVDGKSTDGRTARDIAESVGITLQNPDEQLSEQTVEKEIRFPLEKRRYERTGFLGLSKRERYDEAFIEERVAEVCDLVGLSEDIMQEDPMFLPRGVRRQVTVATALAPDPDVLVLDEPVAGVDGTARRHMTRAIERLRQQGKGVVVIDHDMDFVCEVADTVTVLHEGQVAMQGPTHEVFGPDNWEWLSSHHMRPPRAARLARRVGIEALTADEFVAAFVPQLEVSG